MGVVVIVGTAKGAALLRSDARRESWDIQALRFKGWIVTAATRDRAGRSYVGVTSDVYGAAILVSDDLESWEQLENGPRLERACVARCLVPGRGRAVRALDPLR